MAGGFGHGGIEQRFEESKRVCNGLWTGNAKIVGSLDSEGRSRGR